MENTLKVYADMLNSLAVRNTRLTKQQKKVVLDMIRRAPEHGIFLSDLYDKCMCAFYELGISKADLKEISDKF